MADIDHLRTTLREALIIRAENNGSVDDWCSALQLGELTESQERRFDDLLFLDQNYKDNTLCCLLCRRKTSVIVRSHVIPDNIIKILSAINTSKGMTLIEPNGNYTAFQSSKSVSWKMFCLECEQKFSETEAQFSRFLSEKQRSNKNDEEYYYGDWLYKVLASILWRVLAKDHSLNFYLEFKNLRNYLLDKSKNDLPSIGFFLVPIETEQHNQAFWNRYFPGCIDWWTKDGCVIVHFGYHFIVLNAKTNIINPLGGRRCFSRSWDDWLRSAVVEQVERMESATQRIPTKIMSSSCKIYGLPAKFYQHSAKAKPPQGDQLIDVMESTSETLTYHIQLYKSEKDDYYCIISGERRNFYIEFGVTFTDKTLRKSDIMKGNNNDEVQKAILGCWDNNPELLHLIQSKNGEVDTELSNRVKEMHERKIGEVLEDDGNHTR